jgi:hypothetical protein
MEESEKKGKTSREGIILDTEEDVEWDAVEWTDIEPPSDESVFPPGRVDSILREMLGKAWEDGAISEDAMVLLKTLRDILGIDDASFKALLEETRPLDGSERNIAPSQERIAIWNEGM